MTLLRQIMIFQRRPARAVTPDATGWKTARRAFAVAVTLASLGASALASDDSATHGPDAVPNYDRVFPQDRVTRLDIQVTFAEWQRLMDDMTSMAGAFGTGSGVGGGRFPSLPEEAVAACAGRVEGDVCQFGTPPTTGRCALFGDALTCTPLAAPGGGGAPRGGERDDVELLPNTPVYIPAELTFDGEVFHSVGLRLKGNSTLLNTWSSGVEKFPFRLNFDEFEVEVPDIRDQTFFGFQNINLTNTAVDSTYLHAKVGHDLFREAGVPSPVTGFVRVYLDRGAGEEYAGLYTMVEIPDRAFLDTQFGDAGGQLYKPSGTGGRWTEFDQESFPKKTNESEGDWTDVQFAISALNSSRADAAAWRSRLEATLNVQGFLRWLALNTVIGNFDSYGGLAPHNYYLYGDRRQRDRLQWIPWDLDLAFGSGGGGRGRGNAGTLDLFHDGVDASWPLIRFLMDDATYRATYRNLVEEMLATVFEPGDLTVRLRQEHAMIAPHVVGPDGETPGYTFLQSDAEFDVAFASFISYVETRARAVRSALASTP